MPRWTDVQESDILDHSGDFRLNQSGAPEGSWSCVLIELNGISINTFAKLTEAFAQDMLIPVAYDAEDRAREVPRQPVVLFARRPLIDALNRVGNPYHVTSIKVGMQTPEDQLDFHATPPKHTPIPVDQDAVVMALLDEGIAIAHNLFRSGPVSSRIAHALILDAAPVAGGTSSIGRVLEGPEIDSLLTECGGAGLLDEDLFYERAGLIDWARNRIAPLARTVTHGTFVTSLAAGHPMAKACATRPIICASLPPSLIEDTSGREQLPMLYLAFHALAKQAARFVRPDKTPAPVIFNFSFGNGGGPHDGTGLFAQLFEFYFGEDRDQTAWLTLPAGNLNLSRMHGVVEGREACPFDLILQPDDETPSEVQIWMPTGLAPHAPPLAQVEVSEPGGQSAMITSVAGQSASLVDDAGREIARLSCQAQEGEIQRNLLTLLISPTSHLEGTNPVAPAGTWKIKVTPGVGQNAAPIHLWIRRDETLPGARSRGRQAWFGNTGYVARNAFGAPLAVDPPGSDCPVRRSGTISGFSCGPSPIVVAAYTARDAELSAYSGSGPLAPRNVPPPVSREGPDLAAKGDDSHVLRGVIAAGTRSGSWARLSGTSVAAPRVARCAADEIADAKTTARQWSRAAAKRHPVVLKGLAEPDRSGAGAIDITIPAFLSDT